MLPAITHRQRGVILAIGVPTHQTILTLIGHVARRGPVHVIVGGNRFDVPQLARLLRRHTTDIDGALSRVCVQRPFTAHQTLTLIQQARPTTPVILLDLLTTFLDETMTDQESFRLAAQTATQVRQLGTQTPVLITTTATLPPARLGLLKLLRGVANQVFIYAPPDPTPTQLSLL